MKLDLSLHDVIRMEWALKECIRHWVRCAMNLRRAGHHAHGMLIEARLQGATLRALRREINGNPLDL